MGKCFEDAGVCCPFYDSITDILYILCFDLLLFHLAQGLRRPQKAGLSLYTFDPVAALGGGDKLSAKTSSAGLSAWLDDDPVHLTATAYKDIAGLVLAQAAIVVQGRGPTGRKRLHCIVPVPQPTIHHPANVREPGWISGTENSNNRGGRGSGRGQRWIRGRGRGNRSYPY